MAGPSFFIMLKVAINAPLTTQELKDLVDYVSYHLGYVPPTYPKVIFAKSAKEFATLHEGYKVQAEERIEEINTTTSAFLDHIKDTIVLRAFSYKKGGIEFKAFMIPMAVIIHEIIHFFQYATGTFGSYRVMYEGTNEVLSCLLTGEAIIDWKKEAQYAFNIAMDISYNDFIRAVQWMRTYTLHSDKNSFIHRSLKESPSFSKYSPKKW